MNIKISENIKRMRKAKNITQEQLAELLDVSITAVSKWERNETYPDITLLFPLAHYFGITLDELMGYDEEKIRADIEEVKKLYLSLWTTDFKKAKEIITKAYHDYPNDYWIMHYYMWHLAGGAADNNPEVLLANKDEFLAICDKILAGCTEETLRIEAWNMRAKILHAEGKTDEALDIYEQKYPNFYHTKDQKKEQLFAKDTDEFKHYLRLNIYELSSFAIDKKMKDIWFCHEGSADDKAKKSFALADAFANIREHLSDDTLLLAEYSACICLANYLKYHEGSEEDKLKLATRRQQVVDACNKLAENDEYVKEFIKNRYHCDKLY
ncbi:MAG: helix-turn-helix transcriptional regulator [Lachnospiraceae bacterium]|nr:helix-turn-helix transcriptional regulator [Lachnospiraceae bacterium]